MFFMFAQAYANLGDVCENFRAGATLNVQSRACTDLHPSSPKGLLDWIRLCKHSKHLLFLNKNSF